MVAEYLVTLGSCRIQPSSFWAQWPKKQHRQGGLVVWIHCVMLNYAIFFYVLFLPSSTRSLLALLYSQGVIIC